jgi:hypothetical protein
MQLSMSRQRNKSRLRAKRRAANSAREKLSTLQMTNPDNNASKVGIKGGSLEKGGAEGAKADNSFGIEHVVEFLGGGLLVGFSAIIAFLFDGKLGAFAIASVLMVVGTALLIHVFIVRCRRRWPKIAWLGKLQWVANLLLISLLAVGLISKYRNEHDQVDLLVPADDPLPSTAQYGFVLRGTNSESSHPVFVRLGMNLVETRKTNPLPIIRWNGTNLLSVRVTEDGASVSGQFRSDDGRIVALLENNRFVLGGEAFNPRRPDRHTLIVYDQRNREVLNIRFMNKSSFDVSGVVRTPDGGVIELSEQGVVVNGPNITNRIFSGVYFQNASSIIEVEGHRLWLGRK